MTASTRGGNDPVAELVSNGDMILRTVGDDAVTVITATADIGCIADILRVFVGIGYAMENRTVVMSPGTTVRVIPTPG